MMPMAHYFRKYPEGCNTGPKAICRLTHERCDETCTEQADCRRCMIPLFSELHAIRINLNIISEDTDRLARKLCPEAWRQE